MYPADPRAERVGWGRAWSCLSTPNKTQKGCYSEDFSADYKIQAFYIYHMHSQSHVFMCYFFSVNLSIRPDSIQKRGLALELANADELDSFPLATSASARDQGQSAQL